VSYRVVACFLSVLLCLAALSSERGPAVQPLSQQEVRKLIDTGQYGSLNTHFLAAQADYEAGRSNDEDLRAAFRVFYDTDPALESSYNQWVAQFPTSYAAHLVRGLYHAKLGESLRGVQTVANTSKVSLDGMQRAFDAAARDLDESLHLTRKPILTYNYKMMISGEHADVDTSRRLLDQAIRIDPKNYVVRARYMSVIETRWGGSQDMMQAFLAECRRASLPDRQMRLLESVVAEDQGWIHLFVDHDYAAAEAAYRKSAALGGDPSLPNLITAMMAQKKFSEVIEPLTQELVARPGDANVLANRALAYMNSGRPREAIADWQAAAAAGSADAQNNSVLPVSVHD